MEIHGPKYRLTVGLNVTTVDCLFNTNSGTITVGDETIFGPRCMVITGYHTFDDINKNYYPWDTEGHDIHIGSGCWICAGSIIIGNVTIGNYVVIGAGSVVTHDIPDNTFAAGNPCKIIKKLR